MTYPLTQIEGMTAFAASKLKKLGIRTTEALLEAARTVKGRRELAAKTGIRAASLPSVSRLVQDSAGVPPQSASTTPIGTFWSC